MPGKSGKNMSVTLGGTTHQLKVFTVNGSCNLLENNHSGSGGKEELVEGFTSCNGTLEYEYDPTNSHLDGVIPGSGSKATLELETDTADSHKMTAATIYVESLEVKGDVNGFITATVNWRGTGTDLSTLFGSL